MIGSVEQICRRIIELDSTCSVEKGCPAELSWAWVKAAKEDFPEDETLDQMLRADGQGRGCEFAEISYLAHKRLDRS